MRTLTTAEARAIDRDAVDRLGMPTALLMENAARAVADEARRLGDRFVVLCGPGNNGGDGLAAARHLGGAAVAYCFAPPDPERAPDAALQFRILAAAGRAPRIGSPPDPADFRNSVWIDAIFGIGLRRAPEGLARAYVETFNAAVGPKLSVDVPSGLDSDTGAVVGDVACRADVVVTFVAPKVGTTLPAAAPYVGRVVVAGLGLP